MDSTNAKPNSNLTFKSTSSPKPCPYWPGSSSDELPPPSKDGDGDTGDSYVLGRDYRAASRLNYEHYLWKESLGFDLHPGVLEGLGLGLAPSSVSSIGNVKDKRENSKDGEKEDEENGCNSNNDDGVDDAGDGEIRAAKPPLRIADIACGTSIWLRHVSHLLPPSSILDGYDISLSQCPPQQWLPPNVRLREWDLFTEPYPDMLGVYDVVHVRLLFVVVREGNPGEILESLKRLLKPGGICSGMKFQCRRVLF